MSRKERTLQEILDAIRLAIGVGALLAFLLLTVAVMAYSTPTHTFSDDHYTAANSTDGEDVIVTFEVVYEYEGDMDDTDRKQAMDDMSLAQSCANERLDVWLQSHTADEARNSNLEEITVQCHTKHITIEQVETARGIPA